MNDNRYAPPNAPVGDVQREPTPKQRPREIVLAIQLMVTQFVVGTVVMILRWDFYASLQPAAPTIAGQVIGLAFGIWIWTKIYQGRNWARILLLVSTVVGLLAQATMPAMHKAMLAAPLLVQFAMMSGAAISLIDLWLLFSSPGREWFRKT